MATPLIMKQSTSIPRQRQTVYFVQPHQVACRTETLPPPGEGELLITSYLSAISPGTERLIYQGQITTELPLDDSLADLAGNFEYPFKYGYALVGQVTALGPGVSETWQDRLVLAFHPHESHFITRPAAVFPLPANVMPEAAIFLPNLETAVNLVLDGQPLLGERVVILGQGIVGLLTTALLARFPLAELVTVDPQPSRQQQSLAWGANRSLSPSPELAEQLQFEAGADLIYELSGNPVALQAAIDIAGFESRIVVGSWYGKKPVSLDLGHTFHRQRLRLISSQVSTIAPALSGRWTKARRLEVAWRWLPRIQPASLITHRFPVSQVTQAYHLLDQAAASTGQIVLVY